MDSKKPSIFGRTSQSKSLARELIHSIVVSISLVLIAIMIIGTYSRVHEKSIEVREKAISIADNLRDSLKQPLWNLNKSDVTKLVDSYSQNDFIVAITVYDEDGTVFYENNGVNSRKDLKVKRKIEFEQKKIGRLEASFSLKEVRDLRKSMFVTAFVLALVTIIVTVFVISQKVSTYLSNPIAEPMSGVKNLRLGHYGRSIPTGQYFEFNTIVEEFNTLGSAIESNLKRVSEMSVREGQVNAEIEIGRILQQAMLPVPDARMGSRLKWHYEPAASLAGDWLSFGISPDRKYILAAIGDVTGHGYAQSLVTMAIMGTMWNIVDKLQNGEIMEPRDIAIKLNDLMLKIGAESELNMTASILLVNLGTQEIRYINAGHPFPVILESGSMSQRYRTLTQQSPILGVTSDHSKIQEGLDKFEPGSKLFIYTDGLIEAKDSGGKSYSRKFHRLFNGGKLALEDPQSIIDAVKVDFEAHAGSEQPNDDVCFAVLALDETDEKNIAA